MPRLQPTRTDKTWRVVAVFPQRLPSYRCCDRPPKAHGIAVRLLVKPLANTLFLLVVGCGASRAFARKIARHRRLASKQRVAAAILCACPSRPWDLRNFLSTTRTAPSWTRRKQVVPTSVNFKAFAAINLRIMIQNTIAGLVEVSRHAACGAVQLTPQV